MTIKYITVPENQSVAERQSQDLVDLLGDGYEIISAVASSHNVHYILKKEGSLSAE